MRSRIRPRSVVAAAAWTARLPPFTPAPAFVNSDTKRIYSKGSELIHAREKRWILSRPFSSLSSHHQTCDDLDGGRSVPTHQSQKLEQSAWFVDTIRQSIVNNILPELHSLSESKQIDKLILLLGVSGGCDSVALLHALHRILLLDEGLTHPDGTILQCDLHVVHFDHKQRGVESDGDCRFVQQLCNDLQVPCHIYEWPTVEHSPFSQDKARQWRQENMQALLASLLDQSTEGSTSGLILTAHHKDDSMETLLLKFLRGTHITHLQGMLPFSLIETFPYARPMLKLRKQDAVEFLTSNELSWREDASNASDKYLRNRVRNELVPLMSDLMGGDDILRKRLDHLSEQSTELREHIEGQALEYIDDEHAFVLPATAKLGLVEKEALYLWAKRQGCGMSYDQMQRILDQLSGYSENLRWTLNIGSGWSVVRNGMILTLTSDSKPNLVENTIHDDRVIEWSRDKNGDSLNELGLLKIRFPESLGGLESIKFIASTAGIRRNLTFLPPWRESPVKVREFLRGQKVPLHLRDGSPVICIQTPGGEEMIVAVSLGDSGKWVVGSKFCVESHEGALITVNFS